MILKGNITQEAIKDLRRRLLKRLEISEDTILGTYEGITPDENYLLVATMYTLSATGTLIARDERQLSESIRSMITIPIVTNPQTSRPKYPILILPHNFMDSSTEVSLPGTRTLQTIQKEWGANKLKPRPNDKHEDVVIRFFIIHRGVIVGEWNPL